MAKSVLDGANREDRQVWTAVLPGCLLWTDLCFLCGLLFKSFDHRALLSYSMRMTTILSADGLLEIPEVFREADPLKPGQLCEIERVAAGDYRVHLKAEPPMMKESWVQILRDCPVKDWWEPLDPSNLLITRDHGRLFDEPAGDGS